MLDAAPAPAGHNSAGALPYDLTTFQPLELRARDIADAGADWIKLERVETEEQAQKGNDFLAQVKRIEKDADTERKKQKQPHMDAGKAVDDAFKGLLDPLGKIAGLVKPKLLAFAKIKEDEERREKARQSEEARKASEKAERLKAQAEQRGDVFGQAEAERAAKEAAAMEKAAASPVKTQVKSATGGGRTMAVRKTKRASLSKINIAFGHFRDHENPSYREAIETLLIRMADAELRRTDGPDEIPGFEIRIEETIA